MFVTTMASYCSQKPPNIRRTFRNEPQDTHDALLIGVESARTAEHVISTLDVSSLRKSIRVTTVCSVGVKD